MTNIRVVVAEDSLTVRKHLTELLGRTRGFEVVGEATNGREAIELAAALRPDVLTIDMMMPEVNGLDATAHIMAYSPTPIVIVSSSLNRGDLWKTYDALAAGALDCVEKPAGDGFDAAWEARFLQTLKIASRVKVITHVKARLQERSKGWNAAPRETVPVALGEEKTAKRVLAIGTSTGGPGAIRRILTGLSSGFPLPVLLVIHIGKPFAQALAEWLDSLSPLRVREAVDGERLPLEGCVLLAPADKHLELAGGRLRLSEGPERNHCRPSVDVLFESVARELGPGAIGCLLTGMGSDGATGLLAMRHAGAITLAQDEASSTIFGMPREAARLGAASLVLGLDEMAPQLVRLASSPAQMGSQK